MKLEALNQQDNKKQQTRKSRQTRGANQLKFKIFFTLKMKKSLGIDDQDSWSSLCDFSCKRGIKQLKQESSSVQKLNKKGKKLLRSKQIAIDMNHWILQNATALEQRCLEKMIEEVQAIEDIVVHYSEAIADLTLQEFSILVQRLQKRSDEYRSYIAGQYYLFLARDSNCY